MRSKYEPARTRWIDLVLNEMALGSHLPIFPRNIVYKTLTIF
jgi:hypothetical protein